VQRQLPAMPSKQENLEAVKLWNEAKVPKSAQAKR
jgi:hypothetical protein